MTNPNRIAVLAGGVGGSRFVRGVRHCYPEAQLDVIVNTADDITLHGLRVCPDLDTMMYALGGGIDDQKGWGRAAETWSIMAELKAYTVEPTWFALGDRDIATHLVRTQLIAAGARPTEITAALCARWLATDPGLRLLPMTDDRVETHVVVQDPAAPSGQRTMHFQEFWVREHAEPQVTGVLQVGIGGAVATPEVLAAIGQAELILIGPSNPVVSIGPILATGGVRPALRAASAPIVGISGILGGAPVLGMADKLLPAVGVEVDAGAVGLHYGSRRRAGLLDAWLVHDSDAAAAERCIAADLPCRAVPLLMTTPEHTASFLRAGVELATENRPTP